MDYRERWELKDYLFGRTLERRILVLHVGLGLLLLAFLLDFWYLQGVGYTRYAEMAENNLRRRIPIRATRGEVYDRQQRVLASTRPSLDLLMRREGPHELETQLRRLEKILDVPFEKFSEDLREMRGRPLFEPLVLKEDVSLRELAVIEARREQFPSVEVRQTARRHYPEGGYVPHAIGYVGQVSEAQLTKDESLDLRRGDIVGKAGVERVYDEYLRGTRGWALVSVNNLGRQVGRSRVEREPAHGHRLELTLDLDLQHALVEAFGDEVGGGIFMDPWTGEVLAMTSTPTLDPNLFADGISHEAWRGITEDSDRPLHDRSIASFYAPGSTFKVVLAIAGLETGVIDEQHRTFCNGSATFYGRRRLCWKRGGHGWVDLRDALAQSCNVYFYELGQELGVAEINKYGKIFGLGELSGIDATGEERGILPSAEWKKRTQGDIWYPGDTISVAIGQGYLAVTPIQMARMISGVATAGSLPRPHLRRDSDSRIQQLAIKPSTFVAVQDALARAVRRGTGRSATLGDFSVAGKTGTAQVYKHSAGIDSNELPKNERDHAWFVGYAPAAHPTIAFAVVVEHGGHGGSMAAPIVRKVLEVYFKGTGADSATREQRAASRRPAEVEDVRTPAAR